MDLEQRSAKNGYIEGLEVKIDPPKRKRPSTVNKETLKIQAIAERKEQAKKSITYLTNIGIEYSSFFNKMLQINNPTKNQTGVLRERNIFEPRLEDLKEAARSKNGKNSNIKVKMDVSMKLKYFEGGTLRKYQKDGVNWMAVLHENGLGGILADEMGLGKTIQVIAFLSYLYEIGVKGPYLIVVPLSTLSNWQREFERFAPKLPVVSFYGPSKNLATNLQEAVTKKYKFDKKLVEPIVLTPYHTPLSTEKFLATLTWQYIIVDEGHRLKNHNSMLSKALRSLQSKYRMLLTGTPLQNDVTELWALLNFILPHIFTNMDVFTTLFQLDDVANIEQLFSEDSVAAISAIHKTLAPFMLRRLKSDVLDDFIPKKEAIIYCPLTEPQKKLYNDVITKNIMELMSKKEEINLNGPRPKRRCTLNKTYIFPSIADYEKAEKIQVVEEEKDVYTHPEFSYNLTMNNVLMMFKKIANHPYLVKIPLNPNSKQRELLVTEDLVQSSNKLLALDVILPKLKAGGHKVLIFSTLCMMLDMIEEFLDMRNYKYQRLDGSRKMDDRTISIDEFNQNPECFLFLLSTRAGGLGLNLIAADTVIFIDRDWNPQVDIQAQARCHRIGQTKPVMVYSLVSRNTVDDYVIMKGLLKRRLEKLVISEKTIEDKKDQQNVLGFFTQLQNLVNSEEIKNSHMFSEEEIDRLLDRSELLAQMKSK